MPRGYVSSDDDDYDDYDFGYSEPLVIKKPEPEYPVLPEIRRKEFKEKLSSALKEDQLNKLLSDAVDQGDTEAVEDLIAHGVHVDSSGPQEWTPLMKACVKGQFDMVQFLLERGSDPNKQKELFSPLMACCTHTLVPEELKLNCVRLLLQHGADVNAKDKYKTTALMYASGSGYNDIASELLQVQGVDVNMQDKEGWTALFYAVNHSNISLVGQLISAGTDLKLSDKYGRTVLNLALNKELKEIAEMLGYEEEVHSEQDQKELLLSNRFLEQLPDSEGHGGFSFDAECILAAFIKRKLKNISLPHLLNATEQDLYDIGVRLQPHRLRILSKGIHRFHIQPWNKTSMPEIVEGVPLSLENVVAITGSIARHLTVINATVRYLKTRICSRKEKNMLNISLEEDMVFLLVRSYAIAEKLVPLLSKILTQAKQIKPDIPPDFIYPEKKKNFISMHKLFWYSVGAAATAGLIVGYFKKTPQFGGLMYEHY